MNDVVSVVRSHLSRWSIPEVWRKELLAIVRSPLFVSKLKFWMGETVPAVESWDWLDKGLNLFQVVEDEVQMDIPESARIILVRDFSGVKFEECVQEADYYLQKTLCEGYCDIVYPNWGDTGIDLLQMILSCFNEKGIVSSRLPRTNRWPMRGAFTHKVKETCTGLASLDCNVLISGQSGVGKEAVARYIHSMSPCDGRFVSVSVPAIPTELFSGILFGYEKGAYTGAIHEHAGCFEQAAGGTLFLDEIADIGPREQAALLRALSERRGCAIGGARSYPITCRVIAATNRSDRLHKNFRADLRIRIAEQEILSASMINDWQPLRPLSLVKNQIPLLFAMQYVRCYREQLGYGACQGPISLRIADDSSGKFIDVYKVLSDNEWAMNFRELNQVALHSLLRMIMKRRNLQERGEKETGWDIFVKTTSRYDDMRQPFKNIGSFNVCELISQMPNGIKPWTYIADEARFRAVEGLRAQGKTTAEIATLMKVARTSITRFLDLHQKTYSSD